MEHLNAYKDHCIDQAITVLEAGHDVKCMFTTPKLLEASPSRLRQDGFVDPQDRHHRHLSGGTKITPQWNRFAHRRTARRRRYLHRPRPTATPRWGWPPRRRRTEAGSRRTRSPTHCPAAPRRRPAGRLRRLRRSSSGTARLAARDADDADERVFRAWVSRARRRPARAARTSSIHGDGVSGVRSMTGSAARPCSGCTSSGFEVPGWRWAPVQGSRSGTANPNRRPNCT